MRLSKKIFIFSSIALVVIILFWGIYALVFRQSADEKNSPSNNDAYLDESSERLVAGEPLYEPPIEKDIAQITDEAVLSPKLSPDGQTIKYYSKTTGKTFEFDILRETKKLLSDTDLVGLVDVFWSPDTTKVLSEFKTNTERNRFSFYDYEQKKGIQLHENIDTAIWQNNAKIIYKYFDAATKQGSINIANPDGSDWLKITDISVKDLSIAPIPMSGLISFWNKPDAFTETLLQSASIINGEKKELIKGRFGADYLWSPDGNFILESNLDEKGGSKLHLGITNSLGGEYKSLGVPTFVSKCAWSKDSKFIYYAHPTSIPSEVVIPNDYLAGKFNTSDTFWKVDVSTGEKTRIVELDKIKTSYDATSLFLNNNGSLLFFINKLDGKLYKIAL